MNTVPEIHSVYVNIDEITLTDIIASNFELESGWTFFEVPLWRVNQIVRASNVNVPDKVLEIEKQISPDVVEYIYQIVEKERLWPVINEFKEKTGIGFIC